MYYTIYHIFNINNTFVHTRCLPVHTIFYNFYDTSLFSLGKIVKDFHLKAFATIESKHRAQPPPSPIVWPSQTKKHTTPTLTDFFETRCRGIATPLPMSFALGGRKEGIATALQNQTPMFFATHFCDVKINQTLLSHGTHPVLNYLPHQKVNHGWTSKSWRR